MILEWVTNSNPEDLLTAYALECSSPEAAPRFVEGPPKAGNYTADQLAVAGIVGLYREVSP